MTSVTSSRGGEPDTAEPDEIDLRGTDEPVAEPVTAPPAPRDPAYYLG